MYDKFMGGSIQIKLCVWTVALKITVSYVQNTINTWNTIMYTNHYYVVYNAEYLQLVMVDPCLCPIQLVYPN